MLDKRRKQLDFL